MFSNSTHRSSWFFTSKALAELQAISFTTQKQRRHYILKISQLCHDIQIPHNVEATAMVYFQRFSLRTNIQSTNQLDLKHAVLASIYLAAKVEEWKTGHFERLLRRLAEIGGVHRTIVVQSELKVLQAISFHITVFHPFQCHAALVRELSQTHKWKARLSQIKQHAVHDILNRGGDKELLLFLKNHSLQLLKRSYLTDACFLYSPAQLALASVIAACHAPGIGAASPSDTDIRALKEDVALFAEGYFLKLPYYKSLASAIQSAAALLILPLEL
jgi:hypothetical protein